MSSELIRNIEKETVLHLADLVQVDEGCVNSLTLSQQPSCKITLFAMDKGQGMASHAAGGDALLFALEGSAEIVVNGTPHTLRAEESLVIPTLAPHSVRALQPYKMLLVVVKPQPAA